MIFFLRASMVVTILYVNEVTPPQLSTMVVTELQENEGNGSKCSFF